MPLQTPLMQVGELIRYIFEGKHHDPQFEMWLTTSKRFKSFVETYRDKIRKKVRNVENDSGLKDVYFELQIAFLILGEPRFTLEYEKYSATKQRGPDFTVTFKTNIPFNIEARRIRGLDTLDGERETVVVGRLMDAVCDKVEQLPPSIINILAFTSRTPIQEAELVTAMTTLRMLAERKDEPFFTRRRFKNATEFIRHYHRLSAVLYWSGGTTMTILWANSLAKHAVPKEVSNILVRLSRETQGRIADSPL